MKTEFIAIIQKLIAEQGKDTFVNPARCKAFLPDYTGSEFVKERRLLLKVVETGAAKEIDSAARLDLCKKLQVRHLKEELFIAEDVAADVVDMLALVLRGDTTQTKPDVPPPAPQKPEEALYKISFNFQQSGPYNMARLLRMAEDGQITKDHWICPAGASEWAPVTTIEALKGPIEAREKVETARRAAAEKAAAEQAEAGSQHQPAPPPQDEVPVNDPGKKAKKKSIVENVGIFGLMISTFLAFLAGPEVLANILGPVPVVIEFVVLFLMWFFAVGIWRVICDKIFGKDEA